MDWSKWENLSTTKPWFSMGFPMKYGGNPLVYNQWIGFRKGKSTRNHQETSSFLNERWGFNGSLGLLSGYHENNNGDLNHYFLGYHPWIWFSEGKKSARN